MNGEEDSHMTIAEEPERFSNICVLLLDSDAERLTNLSEMLLKCGYRVVSTARADALPVIMNNKDEKIDLVLAEFRLLEMNRYELLRRIMDTTWIAVVGTGAKVGYDVIKECLTIGAKFCFKKPLTEGDIETLWQYAVRRNPLFVTPLNAIPLEQMYSETHFPSLGDDEYKGEDFELGEETKPEMQNGHSETAADEEVSQGSKRKDYGSDLGEQKKQKLVSGEEGNNESKESTDGRKNDKESEFNIEEALGMFTSHPEIRSPYGTNFPAFEAQPYVFEEGDFQPLESVGESPDHQKISLGPQESSNKKVTPQTKGALDEEVNREDGLSLSDLEADLEEGQGSTSGSDFADVDDFFADLSNELKP